MNTSDIVGIIGIIVSSIGIAVTIWIWKLSVEKKLDLLLQNNTRMNHHQADDLLMLYLEWTRTYLKDAVVEFFNDRFDAVKPDSRYHVDEFIYNKAMDIIGHTRGRLKSFILPNGMSMSLFLDTNNPIDDGIIGNAKEDVINAIMDGVKSNKNKSDILRQSLRILGEASHESLEKLRTDIKKLYD